MAKNRKSILITLAILMFLCICSLGAGLVARAAFQNPEFQSFFSEMGELFQEMIALQGALATKFEAQAFQIKVNNGNALIITVVNSPYNDLGSFEQGERAIEIAEFAFENFGGIDQIDVIYVEFVSNTQVGPFNANSSRVYKFQTKEFQQDPEGL